MVVLDYDIGFVRLQFIVLSNYYILFTYTFFNNICISILHQASRCTVWEKGRERSRGRRKKKSRHGEGDRIGGWRKRKEKRREKKAKVKQRNRKEMRLFSLLSPIE